MASGGAIAIILGVGAAIGVGVAVSNKQQAVADLKISVVKPVINPLKNITGGLLGTFKIPFQLQIRNIHNSSLTIQAVDLTFSLDGKTLASIQDYSGFTIKGVNSANHPLVATTGVPNMALVLGGEVMRAIGGLAQGQKLKDILPKSINVKGQIRALGMVVDIDEVLAVITEEKS